MSQAFKASEALRRTFDVLATRFPTFAGLVLLVQSPLLLLRLAWSSSPPTTAEGRLAVAMLELGGEFVTGALASAAVVYGDKRLSSHYQGQSLKLSKHFRV